MTKYRAVEKPEDLPRDPLEFYRILVSRNHHFVSPSAQERIRNLKVLVAGCGSGGGAIIEPLARLGVTRFRIADNGAYELANFNRQRAYVDNLGQNKADFHADAVRRLNPHADMKAFPEGLSPENIEGLVAWADLIFDCVDVTTPSGMEMKLSLHELAHAGRKPVFFMLDLGFCQKGKTFDYRDRSLKPLGGKLEAARRIRNPMKALLSFYPISNIPGHTLQLFEDALLGRDVPISQLECASDLLSCVSAAAVIRYAECGEIVKGWNIDLDGLALPAVSRLRLRLAAPWKRSRIRRLMRQLP